jgi:hypothetical protein
MRRLFFWMTSVWIWAETIEGRWRPGIGDPSLAGWMTVLAYFAASGWCFVVARREPRQVDPSRSSELMRGWGSPFWCALGILLVFLGLNKQLDLQSLFTQIARDLARAQGWYGDRHVFQKVFVWSILSLGAVVIAILGWLFRRQLRRRWLVLIGLCLLLVFIFVRASSFHHVDVLLGSRLGGIKWNWILELGAIGLIMLGGWVAARPEKSGPASLQSAGPHMRYRYRR